MSSKLKGKPANLNYRVEIDREASEAYGVRMLKLVPDPLHAGPTNTSSEPKLWTDDGEEVTG